MASKGKTGPFPKSPRDMQDFRAAQLDSQKGFKGGTTPSNPFKGYSANVTTEKDRGPYGRLKDSGAGHEGNTVKNVNDGTMNVPKKSRDHMGETLPFTKVPRGLYHPVRGEYAGR